MKSNYDFSKGIQNPFAKKLKKTICIKLDDDVIEYFKTLSEKVGVPYQGLINMFLQQAKNQKMEPLFIPRNKPKKTKAA
ncbi:MAG: BrnA antitoxin family protein [Fibrobacter sp.]|nr:BrnA antitoxin family protein [Fibrobacter sp.]